MTSDRAIEARDAAPQSVRMLALLLVVLPILINAIALLPEVRYGAPSDNDQIFHYLFIERANQALAAGDNPVDHWLPELELGFPQFHYYQNLPHLTVVALHHLLLERVSLLTLLNLIRYLLMVLFPLTVYWSMRRMEFSIIAAAVGAAFSSTLSSAAGYGFDYHSYIWAGLGMFPQLCSMHLMFIGIACVHQVLERGRGFAAAIVASAAMVLTDLLYGYIFALGVAILFLLSVVKEAAAAKGIADAARRISRPVVRLTIVAGVAAAIAAYQIVPFLVLFRYVNQTSPELPPRFFSLTHKGGAIASSLIGGQGYDNHRLPVTATLVLLGIVYSAITRSRAAKLALTFLASFIFLMLSPIFLGPLIGLLPLWKLLPVVRLIAGRDFAAIMLAGPGGGLIWMWWPAHGSRVRAAAAAAILVTFCIVALVERWNFYQRSTNSIELTAQAIEDDTDLAQVIAALKQAPPGRVYAGTRGNWGGWMSIGLVALYDLLPVEEFETVMPWQTLSLNSVYLWGLNIPNSKLCTLFNIRYIVAPPQLQVPEYYRPLLTTDRYILYQLDSGGYMELGQVAQVLPLPISGHKFMVGNQKWIASDEPARGRFIAYRSNPGQMESDLEAAIAPASLPDSSPSPGSIEDEVITPDSMSAQVSVTTSALLVLKVSYHPNWHVIVDGREQRTVMVSPSFIGTMLAPGKHQVRAEYRSSRLKKALMVLGGLILAATIGIWAFGLEPGLTSALSDA
jgi:hypothetical protein